MRRAYGVRHAITSHTDVKHARFGAAATAAAPFERRPRNGSHAACSIRRRMRACRCRARVADGFASRPCGLRHAVRCIRQRCEHCGHAVQPVRAVVGRRVARQVSRPFVVQPRGRAVQSTARAAATLHRLLCERRGLRHVVAVPAAFAHRQRPNASRRPANLSATRYHSLRVSRVSCGPSAVAHSASL